MIYEDSGVKARPHKSAVRAHQVDRVYAFWVVLEGGTWTSPLTVSSPEGRAAIALFSGEEEARMFCHFGRMGAKGCVRVTSAGGVLSLLYGPWSVTRHVALDPFPEVLGSRRLLGPLTLDRERFARSFAGGAGYELDARTPRTATLPERAIAHDRFLESDEVRSQSAQALHEDRSAFFPSTVSPP